MLSGAGVFSVLRASVVLTAVPASASSLFFVLACSVARASLMPSVGVFSLTCAPTAVRRQCCSVVRVSVMTCLPACPASAPLFLHTYVPRCYPRAVGCLSLLHCSCLSALSGTGVCSVLCALVMSSASVCSIMCASVMSAVNIRSVSSYLITVHHPHLLHSPRLAGSGCPPSRRRPVRWVSHYYPPSATSGESSRLIPSRSGVPS